MIIFHEGLPRAGKSYEAMVRRIIPALKAGRCVDAYVEGIDHERIAEIVGIDLETAQKLLVVLSREQVEDIPKFARDNALVVLDEAQNFWGANTKMNRDMTQFVTEHGHRGIDIVLMGQSLKDVNVLWRRRVELKMCFLKLNGLGRAGRYSVTTWRHKGDEKFTKVGTETLKYEEEFFGTYKSHVSDLINTETYVDDRGNVLSSKVMRYGYPAFALVLVVSLWWLWGYFHRAPAPKPQSSQAAASATPSGQQAQPVRAVHVATVAPAPEVRPLKSPIERHLSGFKDARLRLAGLGRMGDRVNGVVEWIGGDGRVLERLSLDQLRRMGVAIVVNGEVVQLAVGEWNELATSWPLDIEAKVPQDRLANIKEQSPYLSPDVGSLRSRPVAQPDLPGRLTVVSR